MAKKKSKKVAVKKAAPKKKTPAKKPAAKKKAAPKKKAAAKKPAAKKKARAAGGKPPSLGRPLVTGEEKLYLLFREDYHARQIFEFLRVETVRELEQYSPQEIVHRLSRPIRQTVDVIRRKLAAKNRSLAGDEEFAAKHKASAPSS
jgi:hypothetical protein